MNKVVGIIIFIGAAAFLAYMLITGQVYIAWERVILYALIGGGISLAGSRRAKKLKKQDEAADYGADGGDARLSVSGVVRPGVDARGLINFLLIFIWLVILVCTALAAADGAFSDGDGSTLGSFGALIAVAGAATVGFTWFLNIFCCELSYTSGGVTVKKGKKEQHYSWGEIGSYTQRNYLYIFCDREGKRLFFTNSSYEGFGEFFDQYLRTRSGYYSVN